MKNEFAQLIEQIGVSPSEKNTDELAKIARYFADTFPFENLDVLQKNTEKITPQFLNEKLVKQKRGGLCYEINAFLYLVLQALEYDVVLVKGTVRTDNGWATEGTHVLNIVNLHNKRYVLDNGFGSNITRKPLEIDGAPVDAPTGTFRVVQRESDKGTYAYEKFEKGEWVLKFAFHLEPIAWDELNHIKQVITESEASAFNRQIIISQCLKHETYSINESRLRVKRTDMQEKDTIFHSEEELLHAIKQRSNSSIYVQAQKILLK